MDFAGKFVATSDTGVVSALRAILQDIHAAFGPVPFAAKSAFCPGTGDKLSNQTKSSDDQYSRFNFQVVHLSPQITMIPGSAAFGVVLTRIMPL